MTDRRIVLSTGEASIILDSPNVVITAQGPLTTHAHQHTPILAEGAGAIAARESAAVMSTIQVLVLQAGKDLHLNPFEAPRPLSRAETIAAGGSEPRQRCPNCGSEMVQGEGGLVCPNAKDGDAEESDEEESDELDSDGAEHDGDVEIDEDDDQGDDEDFDDEDDFDDDDDDDEIVEEEDGR